MRVWPGCETTAGALPLPGVLLLWLLLSAITSHFNLNSLSGVASSASFLVIVAIGQMFVIASGGGNIDLSLPSVMTVSAFVALIFPREQMPASCWRCRRCSPSDWRPGRQTLSLS